MNEKKILITSVGNTSGSFFTLLDALLTNNKNPIKITDIYIVSTKGPNNCIIDKVFKEIKNEKENYPLYKNITIHYKTTLFEDITNEKQVIEFTNILSKIFDECVKETNSVYVSIASARKEMSTIADRLSMLYGINETYHVRLLHSDTTKPTILESQILGNCQRINDNGECKNFNLFTNQKCFESCDQCKDNRPSFLNQKYLGSFDHRLHVAPIFLHLIRIPVIDINHLAILNNAIDMSKSNNLIPYLNRINGMCEYFFQRGILSKEGTLTEWGIALQNLILPTRVLGKKLDDINISSQKESKKNKWITFLGGLIFVVQIFMSYSPQYKLIYILVSFIIFLSIIWLSLFNTK